MMNYGMEKRKFISSMLFVILALLLAFWAVIFGPGNSKYFSIVYLAAGFILMLFGMPFIPLKRAWVFFLFIVINFAVLLVYLFDKSSLLNIITLIVSYSMLYYLVSTGVRYLGVYEFENTTFKYLLYILLLSLIVSPLLTIMKWPYAPAYFPWQALVSDQRFLLIVGKNVGHSNAMWLMAFGAAYILRNIYRQKKYRVNFVYILFLFLLVWGLIATKSRTALLFIIILFLQWAGYSRLISKRFFALVPVIAILVFYMSVLNPFVLSKVYNVVNDLQGIFPSIRIIASAEVVTSVYSGREILSNSFISSFIEHPWFGAGHSASIFVYGVNREGNIAYAGDRFAVSESMLRLLAKYGSMYFAALLMFILTPLVRAFNGFYRDNIFVISVCSIILVSGINGNVFENLYDISSLFTIIILIYMVMPKYDPGKFQLSPYQIDKVNQHNNI